MAGGFIVFPTTKIVDENGYITKVWQRFLQNPQFVSVNLVAPNGVASGGTGLNVVPAIGQTLIGTGAGYILATLTAGQGVAVINAAGSITIQLNNTAVTPNPYGSASAVPVITINQQGQITNAVNTPIVIPSSAVTGTTTNDTAAVGFIGEYVTAVIIKANAIALTTLVTANVTSISLTAGEWDVTGVIDFTPAATTTTVYMQGGISLTSAATGGQDTSFTNPFSIATTAVDSALPCPIVQLKLSATTTVFLIATASFAVSTLKAYGTIRARRVR